MHNPLWSNVAVATRGHLPVPEKEGAGKTIKSPIAAAVQADATRDAQWDQMYFIARPNLFFFPFLPNANFLSKPA